MITVKNYLVKVSKLYLWIFSHDPGVIKFTVLDYDALSNDRFACLANKKVIEDC